MRELADAEAELAQAADKKFLLDVLAGLVEGLQFVLGQMVVARSAALDRALISL